MPFENFNHEHLIIHEVFKRDDERQIVDPRFGIDVEKLNGEAASAFRGRLVSTLGTASSCVEMEISEDSPESMFGIAKALMDADQALFTRQSRKVAEKLANSQKTRNIPGGILVVFTGTVGAHHKKRMFGVIKAEPQDGFVREPIKDGVLKLRFLKDLFLTPQTKLYKVGAFVENDPKAASVKCPSAGYRVFVYDELMTGASHQKAAQYFYESFLGCKFPESGARLTRVFYSHTKEFIRGLNITDEKKVDLYTALQTYLKTDQRAVIEVAGFGRSFFSEEQNREYSAYMAEKEFPLRAVQKDISQMGDALRTRRIVFSKNIKLTAPSDSFKDMVQINTIPGDEGIDGAPSRWTRITVKDHIRSQD